MGSCSAEFMVAENAPEAQFEKAAAWILGVKLHMKENVRVRDPGQETVHVHRTSYGACGVGVLSVAV